MTKKNDKPQADNKRKSTKNSPNNLENKVQEKDVNSDEPIVDQPENLQGYVKPVDDDYVNPMPVLGDNIQINAGSAQQEAAIDNAKEEVDNKVSNPKPIDPPRFSLRSLFGSKLSKAVAGVTLTAILGAGALGLYQGYKNNKCYLEDGTNNKIECTYQGFKDSVSNLFLQDKDNLSKSNVLPSPLIGDSLNPTAGYDVDNTEDSADENSYANLRGNLTGETVTKPTKEVKSNKDSNSTKSTKSSSEKRSKIPTKNFAKRHPGTDGFTLEMATKSGKTYEVRGEKYFGEEAGLALDYEITEDGDKLYFQVDQNDVAYGKYIGNGLKGVVFSEDGKRLEAPLDEYGFGVIKLDKDHKYKLASVAAIERVEDQTLDGGIIIASSRFSNKTQDKMIEDLVKAKNDSKNVTENVDTQDSNTSESLGNQPRTWEGRYTGIDDGSTVDNQDGDSISGVIAGFTTGVTDGITVQDGDSVSPQVGSTESSIVYGDSTGKWGWNEYDGSTVGKVDNSGLDEENVEDSKNEYTLTIDYTNLDNKIVLDPAKGRENDVKRNYDPLCAGLVIEPNKVTQCSDGIDNDGNGKIDLEDYGCVSSDDTDEAIGPCVDSYTIKSSEAKSLEKIVYFLEREPQKEIVELSNNGYIFFMPEDATVVQFKEKEVKDADTLILGTANVTRYLVYIDGQRVPSNRLPAVIEGGHTIKIIEKPEFFLMHDETDGYVSFITNNGNEVKIVPGEEYATVKEGAIKVHNCADDPDCLPEKKEDQSDKKDNKETSYVKSKDLGLELVVEAERYLGNPYVLGGNNPEKGIDCSGFVKYLYQEVANIELPRKSSSQFKNAGMLVDKTDLEEGDLVFFDTKKPYKNDVTHVGMYIGNNEFIHASGKKRGIIISKLNSDHYTKRYVGAKRMLSDEQLGFVSVDNQLAGPGYLVVKFSGHSRPVNEEYIIRVEPGESNCPDNGTDSQGTNPDSNKEDQDKNNGKGSPDSSDKSNNGQNKSDDNQDKNSGSKNSSDSNNNSENTDDNSTTTSNIGSKIDLAIYGGAANLYSDYDFPNAEMKSEGPQSFIDLRAMYNVKDNTNVGIRVGFSNADFDLEIDGDEIGTSKMDTYTVGVFAGSENDYGDINTKGYVGYNISVSDIDTEMYDVGIDQAKTINQFVGNASVGSKGVGINLGGLLDLEQLSQKDPNRDDYGQNSMIWIGPYIEIDYATVEAYFKQHSRYIMELEKNLVGNSIGALFTSTKDGVSSYLFAEYPDNNTDLKIQNYGAGLAFPITKDNSLFLDLSGGWKKTEYNEGRNEVTIEDPYFMVGISTADPATIEPYELRSVSY